MRSSVTSSTLAILSFTFLQFGFAPRASANACFDPAIEAGYAAKDPAGESLVVLQLTPPAKGAKFGDMIIGVAVKGLYYGCKVAERAAQPRTMGVRKFNVFLPLVNAPVQGFELDVSTESRRVLGIRAIQVPWDVVDRSKGVTASCAASTSTTFEGFLYGALRNAKSRRCTETEIQALVGKNRVVSPPMVAPRRTAPPPAKRH